jgi:predicted GNAT superfamily acetyltransferase
MKRAKTKLQLHRAVLGTDSGADGIELRRVETQDEYDECVRIQDETWGAGFNERVPSTILRVSQYLGGVTAAAFGPDGGRMLGFVFGMTGVQEGSLVHWSDLLAVRPEAQGRGVGRRLKLFQRSLVIPLGVTRMSWTFDPLVARNAHLNLNVLGASVDRYVPDMYGADTGSALHSAVGTDRFIVVWDLTSNPSLPQGRRIATPPPRSLIVNRLEPAVEPRMVHRNDDAPQVYIAVPDDIQDVIAAAPNLARAWRESSRKAFLWYLDRDYRVSGFHRAGGYGYYHLAQR